MGDYESYIGQLYHSLKDNKLYPRHKNADIYEKNYLVIYINTLKKTV